MSGGASPDGDRAFAANAVEPVPVSPVPASIPCAGSARGGDSIERREKRWDALYRELRLAALEERVCPSNLDLMLASGYSRRDSISVALRVMQDAGDLEVFTERGIRVVRFPDGSATANAETFGKVRDITARAFGVEPYQLVTRGRKEKIVRARFAAIAVLRARFPSLSLVAVGVIMGDRDHSTIVHAVERCKRLRLDDDEFRRVTDELSAGRKADYIPPARPSRRKCMVDHLAAPPPRQDFSWCEQCESRVAPERALRCASRWCSLKATA